MRPKATRTFLRAVLVAAILVITLAGSTLDKSGRVGATSCDDAWMAYLNASFNYETARVSYFYGEPTSCAQQCQYLQGQAYTDCVEACQISRHTTLGQAYFPMFSTALDTCTPADPNQCNQAQAIATNCLVQYDAGAYSDPEEAEAVANQYAACWEASKIDSCR